MDPPCPKPTTEQFETAATQKEPVSRKEKSVPWEQERQGLTCWFSTFSAWQHVWDRLSKEPYFSGALHSSFHSTELLICCFWQQSLSMCELQSPCQISSYHNCQAARPPGQAVCWGVAVSYLPGMADYHCLPHPEQTLPCVQVSVNSNKLLVGNCQRLVWRSLYLLIS